MAGWGGPESAPSLPPGCCRGAWKETATSAPISDAAGTFTDANSAYQAAVAKLNACKSFSGSTTDSSGNSTAVTGSLGPMSFPTYGDASWRSPNTVRGVIAPLRALLATAVEEGLIRHNPAAGLRLAGGDHKQAPKALAPDELERLIAEMPEGTPRLLVRFLAATGPRAGELAGLVWGDIDIDTRRVNVTRRIYRGRVDAPKSRYGVRTIPLGSLTADLIANNLASPYAADADPVFASGVGTPTDLGNFSTRVLKPAAKRAGVPWASLHTLRHTCASNLLRAGVPAKQVQVWMGHHSAAFTLTTYGHLLPDDLPSGEIMDRFVGVTPSDAAE